jgi:hypothetical protein
MTSVYFFVHPERRIGASGHGSRGQNYCTVVGSAFEPTGRLRGPRAHNAISGVNAKSPIFAVC